jgi:adenosylcobinamide-GDP ribazoletransferase
MHNFFAAMRFLTIVPVPNGLGDREEHLSGALPYFPLVGILIGGFTYLFSFLVLDLFNPVIASLLIVLLLIGASGGLHMDGLCDTADGFFSSRPRERILEIMRDSRVGAMGVLALVMNIAIKTAALASLNPYVLPVVVFLIPVAGRCVQLFMMGLMPYARVKSGGLASVFYSRTIKFAPLWGGLYYWPVAWLIAGKAGLLVFSLLIVVMFLFSYYCYKKIGGITGDTLGASCELAETGVALFFAMAPINNLIV